MIQENLIINQSNKIQILLKIQRKTVNQAQFAYLIKSFIQRKIPNIDRITKHSLSSETQKFYWQIHHQNIFSFKKQDLQLMTTPYRSQKQYISHSRQQAILIDLNLVFNLFYYAQQKSKQNQSKSLVQRDRSAFSINQSAMSMFSTNQTYLEYAQKFKQLNYQSLLFLICRKKIYAEFIRDYLQLKYCKQYFQNQDNKIVNQIKRFSPEINLQNQLFLNWSQYFSKQHIFNDIIQIQTYNISRNWKANTLLVQKNLQKAQISTQQSQTIFKTEPNIEQTEKQKAKKDNKLSVQSPKKIQESTRQILSKLSQIKREMEQCQAQMNIAKNNENRVIQQSNEYSKKKRQYNNLKQKYRNKSKISKNEKLLKNIFINKPFQSSSLEKQPILKIFQKIVKEGIDVADNVLQNMDQKKQKLNKDILLSENILDQMHSKKPEKQSISDNIQNNANIQSNNNNLQMKEKRTQKESEYKNISLENFQKKQKQNLQKMSSMDNKMKKFQQKTKQQTKIIIPKKILQISEIDFDELIKVLNLLQKQNIAAERLKELKNSSANVNQASNSRLQDHSSFNLVSSKKELLFQKYIKRIFHYYILEQNQNTSSFNKANIIAKNKSLLFPMNQSMQRVRQRPTKLLTQNYRSVSPSENFQLQKKLSLNYSTKNTYNERRNSIADPYSVKSKNGISPLKTLSSSESYIDLQMNIQSYSKFIRAFQLPTKIVSFSQIIRLFKQESKSKRSITYFQFVQLFQKIYRFECSKLQIQFTPQLFDSFLRKQILNWDKINKVLRLKTTFASNKSKISTNQSILQGQDIQRPYKFNFVSHSGKLSQQIQQKINASKKPFLKMPCMSLDKKKRPVNFSESKETAKIKTKIQQKIEKIVREKQMQKQRLKTEYQAYRSLQLKKEQLRQKSQENKQQSHSPLFKKNNKKKYLQQKIRENIQNNDMNKQNPKKIDKISQNLELLKQYKVKSNQSQNFSYRSYFKTQSKNQAQQMEQQINNIYFYDKKAEAITSKVNKIHPFKGITFGHQNKFINEQQSLDLNRRQNQQNARTNQMVQLERMIGILSSDDEEFQEFNPQDQYEKDHFKSQESIIQNYQNQISGFRKKQNIKTKIEGKTKVQTDNTEKHNVYKPFKKQQDQYLERYLSKQRKQYSSIPQKKRIPAQKSQNSKIFNNIHQNQYLGQSINLNKQKWNKYFVHY